MNKNYRSNTSTNGRTNHGNDRGDKVTKSKLAEQEASRRALAELFGDTSQANKSAQTSSPSSHDPRQSEQPSSALSSKSEASSRIDHLKRKREAVQEIAKAAEQHGFSVQELRETFMKK